MLIALAVFSLMGSIVLTYVECIVIMATYTMIQHFATKIFGAAIISEIHHHLGELTVTYLVWAVVTLYTLNVAMVFRSQYRTRNEPIRFRLMGLVAVPKSEDEN